MAEKKMGHRLVTGAERDRLFVGVLSKMLTQYAEMELWEEDEKAARS